MDKPHAIVGVNVFAADTDAQGRKLMTSMQQAFLNMVRGNPSELPPPVDSMEGLWSESEEMATNQRTQYSVVGSPESIHKGLTEIIEGTQADELMFTANIYDHAARMNSFEIAAEVMKQVNHGT